MAKKVSNETKMKNSRERIEKLFNWAENEKFSVSGKGELDSYEDYENKMKTLMNKYADRYGVYEIVKIEQEKMMDLIKEEYPNPHSQKAMTRAADFFTKASGKSDVFKEPVRVVNIGHMEDYWDKNKILRRAKDSTVLKATHDDCEKVIDALKDNRSPFSNQAILAIELGRRVGARIEGSLSLRGTDITINSDGTATVHLNEKGNLDRWVSITNPADVEFLEKLKGRLPNQDYTVMKQMHYRSGENANKIMPQDVAGERLAKVVQSSAIKVGLSNPSKKDEPAFSIHSSRKTFCQTRVDGYYKQPTPDLKDELHRRMDEQDKLHDKLKEENPNYTYTSFREKYEKAVDRVNWVDKDEGIRRTEKDRDLNHKELCFLLASFDSGHFRVDILRYYADYPPKK